MAAACWRSRRWARRPRSAGQGLCAGRHDPLAGRLLPPRHRLARDQTGGKIGFILGFRHRPAPWPRHSTATKRSETYRWTRASAVTVRSSDHRRGRSRHRARCSAMNAAICSPPASRPSPIGGTTRRARRTRCDAAAQVDVLVIGSGYTGLMAARETAQGGRTTLVIDAESAGWGCSSRNGGQVSTSIKPSFEDASAAATIRRRLRHPQGRASPRWTTSTISSRREARLRLAPGRPLPCRAQSGAIRGAGGRRKPAQGPGGADGHGARGRAAPRNRQRLYYGGAVYPRHASLHPGKYHQGLLRPRAGRRRAGHRPLPGTAIERDGAGSA